MRARIRPKRLSVKRCSKGRRKDAVFPVPGLGQPQHVASLQHNGNAPLLDGSGNGIADLPDGVGYPGIKRKLCKTQFNCSLPDGFAQL